MGNGARAAGNDRQIVLVHSLERELSQAPLFCVHSESMLSVTGYLAEMHLMPPFGFVRPKKAWTLFAAPMRSEHAEARAKYSRLFKCSLALSPQSVDKTKSISSGIAR
jgi:hypothetical protein